MAKKAKFDREYKEREKSAKRLKIDADILFEPERDKTISIRCTAI